MCKGKLRTAIWLIALYIGAQMVADVTAVKMVTVLGLVIPGGTLIYAITFTLRDLIHRSLGAKAARQTIVAAGVVNILMALYFYLAVRLPYPEFWGLQTQFASVLGIVWSIVLASIVAEVAAELADTEVYSLMWSAPAWTKVLVSNLVSIPLDSILFAGLAFYAFPLATGQHTMPLAAIWTMIKGQAIFKYIVGACIMPAIYLIRIRKE